MTRSVLLVSFFLGLSLILDQSTKILAEKTLMTWSHPENLKDYSGRRFFLWAWPITREQVLEGAETDYSGSFVSVSFNYVRNQGAAWGFLNDLRDDVRVPLFHIMTLLAVTALIFYLRTTPREHIWARRALLLILSGACGNFLDRLVRGYVIDFIDIRWNLWGWFYMFPNFNWADSCITIGVTVLLVDSILGEPLRQRKNLITEASPGSDR